MPPIPITFHTRPTSHRYAGGTNTAKQPLYFSVDHKSKHRPNHPIAPSPQISTVPPTAPTTVPSSSASGSGSSSTSTTPAPSARRKSTAVRAPSTSTKGYITLTPLNSAILERCLLVNQSTLPTPAISPRKTTHTKSTSSSIPSVATSAAGAHPHIHPYSRLSDLGNDRSPNPSPREILRAQRAEAEKARTKKDSVAAARAAVAAKRKPKARNGRSGKNSAQRSPSPSNEVRGLLGLGGSGLRQEVLPTITTEMASPEFPPAPTPTSVPAPSSRSLKRTRSAGIPPLSTGMANALGSGNLGIGSPLKAVIGPEAEDDEGEAGDRRAKRSRTQEPAAGGKNPGPSGLGGSRKKSHSPNSMLGASTLPGALPIPKTVPMAAGRLVPSVTRQSGRASSVAVSGVGGTGGVGGAGATGLGVGESAGGVGMRRAVSAAGAEAARRDSMGSQGSEGLVVPGGGRSRREVNLPRALRDYETRPGTMV